MIVDCDSIFTFLSLCVCVCARACVWFA